MWLPCYLSALKWKAVTVLFWMHLLWAQQCCIGSEAKFNQWLVSTKNTWWEDKHHAAGLCRTLSVWGCKSKHQRCFISPLQSPVFYRRLRLKGWHFNLWLLTSTAMRWGASCIRSPRLWLLQNTFALCSQQGYSYSHQAWFLQRSGMELPWVLTGNVNSGGMIENTE